MNKKNILERLYYICATMHCIAGRKDTYKEVIQLIYDITGNENYNPAHKSKAELEEPNELIRITKTLKEIINER